MVRYLLIIVLCCFSHSLYAQSHKVSFTTSDARTGSGPLWLLVSDEYGKYVASDYAYPGAESDIMLPPGKYVFSSSGEYALKPGLIEVSDSDQVIGISMAGYRSVTFQAVGADNEVITGLPVNIFDSGNRRLAYATTSTDGEATVYVPDGDYTYTVGNARGYETKSDRLSLSGEDKRIIVPYAPYSEVNIKITGRNNTDIGALPITVYDEDYNVMTSGTLSSTLFTCYLPDGNYIYKIGTGDYAIQRRTFTVSGKTDIRAVYYPVTFLVTGNSGSGIEGMSIDVYDQSELIMSVTTSSGGEYTFCLMDGIYQYAVKGLNYPDKNGILTVSGIEQSVAVTYSDFYPVTIIATGADNQPLNNALLTINDKNNKLVTTGATDYSGTCAIHLPDGDYICQIEKAGTVAYARKQESFSVTGSSRQVQVSYTSGYYAARFQLKDKTAAGISDAAISMISNADEPWIPSLYTDADGKCVVYLPAGHYTYSANTNMKDGYVMKNGNLTITNSAVDIPVSYGAEYVKTTFQVTNISGFPLAYAYIYVYTQANVVISGYTDIAGKFIAQLPQGSYTYSVNEYVAGLYPVQKGTAEITSERTILISYASGYYPVHIETTGIKNTSHWVGIQISNESAKVSASIYQGSGDAYVYLPTGTYTYRATSPYYSEKSGSIQVKNASQELLLNYAEYKTVTFSISDINGTRMNDCEIQVYNDQNLHVGTVKDSDKQISLLPGEYSYTIMPNNGYPAVKRFLVLGEKDQTVYYSYASDHYALNVHMEFPPQTSVTSYITIKNNYNELILSTSTATDAVTLCLPDGNYSYYITSGGFADKYGQVIISGASKTLEISYVDGYFPIKFQVTNPGNVNLINIHIFNDLGYIIADGYTNTEGSCTLQLPEGEYSYEIGNSAFGRKKGSFSITNAGRTIMVTFDQHYNVTFKVTDANNIGIEGMNVFVDGSWSNQYTSANGECTFGLPDGEYNYTITGRYASKTGKVVVNGESQVVNIQYANDYYPVTFQYQSSPDVRIDYLIVNVFNEKQVQVASYSVGPDESQTIFFLAGNYSYEASSGKYASDSYMAIQRTGTLVVDKSLTVTLSYEDYQAISFQIIKSDEIGLSYADVYIYDAAEQEIAKFRLNPDQLYPVLMPNGNYTWKAVSQYPEQRGAIAVYSSKQTIFIEYVDTYYDVLFEVKDGDRFVPDANIIIKDRQLKVVGSGVVSDEGYITFYLPNGDYTYDVWTDDLSLSNQTFAITSKSRTVYVNFKGTETGVDSKDVKPAVIAFPNPVTDIMTVDCGKQDTYFISIYDVSGKVVYRNTFTADIVTLDMSGYAAGLYILYVENSKTQGETVKLIKK